MAVSLLFSVSREAGQAVQPAIGVLLTVLAVLVKGIAKGIRAVLQFVQSFPLF
jgi:hypothetical protein